MHKNLPEIICSLKHQWLVVIKIFTLYRNSQIAKGCEEKKKDNIERNVRQKSKLHY